MTGYIPVPPDGWVPTSTRSDNYRLPDATMTAIADSSEIRAKNVAVRDALAVIAESSRFAGIDPTGATTSRVGLQNALNAAVDTGVLEIPGGTYRVTGSTSILNLVSSLRRGITIRGRGPVTIINDLDGGRPVFELTLPFENETAVSAISSVTIANDNTDFPGTTYGVQLTVASAPAWPRGTVVKLIADDAIAEDRPESGGTVAREGQTFRVHSSSGTTIVLQGALLGSFTTGIRVAKFSDAKIVIEGITVDIPDSKVGTGTHGGLAVIRGAKYPVVRNCEVSRVSGAALSLEGCFGYVVDGFRVGFGYDNPGSNILGYAINDKSSSLGRVEGLVCGAVRHAFTTNSSSLSAASASIHAYGRSYYTTVTGKVTTSTNAAFDTHHGAYGIHFASCEALNAPVGVQLRGLHNLVTNFRAKNTRVGVRVYEESGGGYTRFSTVDGASMVDVAVPIEEIHDPSGTTRETALSVYRNIDARRVTSGNVFTNATANVFDIRMDMAATCEDTSAAFYSDGSLLRLYGSNVVDYSGTSAGASLKLYDTDTSVASIFEQWGLLDYRHSSQVTTLLRNGGSTTLRISNISATALPSTLLNATPVSGSQFDWENRGNGTSSSYLAVTGANITTATNFAAIGRTKKSQILVELDPSGADRTIPSIPDALVRNIRVVFFHRGSANNVVVKNAANALLIGATDKTLTTTQRLEIVSGVDGWRQIGAVA